MLPLLHKPEKINKILKEPFSHNVWLIFLILIRIIPYNDTKNLCKFQKNLIKMLTSSRE